MAFGAFGRDTQRRTFERHAGRALAGVLAGEGARLELVNAVTVRAEAAALGLLAAQGPVESRAGTLLQHAALLREHARRTGAAEDLARAADAADRALRLMEPARVGPAKLELGLCALQAAELFGDPAALHAAATRLAACRAADDLPALPAARRLAAHARAASAQAIAHRDLDQAIAAAQDHDEAVDALDVLARRDAALRPDAALARVARAELLTAFGVMLKEACLAAQAADDLALVSDRLDPNVTPLTFARVEIQRAEALSALGELNGDAAALAEAVAALLEALSATPVGWSPLDRARAGRALGLARQALAEATDEPALFDLAAEAFDAALAELSEAQGLPLRAACAFDRALALTRRAEQIDDPESLDWAEGALKTRLAAHDPTSDPVAWAALQVALARVYGLREAAVGDGVGRAEAALALEAAVDVFTERGLKSLAEQALALGR